MVVLGDRYEIFATAIAAFVLKIPIAHIHGGEVTQGVLDDGFRHSISKLASLHFTANSSYRNRLIQMGENPKRVFTVGAPGLDTIKRTKLKSKSELAKIFDIDFTQKIALVTYHPVMLGAVSPLTQITNLLRALDTCDLFCIFTMTNADEGGALIAKEIDGFINDNPVRRRMIKSFGQINYLSMLKYVQIMIGNSSSGILEAPSFNLPVVNIGDRQNGRIFSKNIFRSGYSTSSIQSTIKEALAATGKVSVTSPFGDGNASKRIVKVLRSIRLDDTLLQKGFYDLHRDSEG